MINRDILYTWLVTQVNLNQVFTRYLGVPKKSSFAKQVSSNNIQLQNK